MHCNALSFDIEDYFHIQAYHEVIEPRTWENFPSTVESNVNELLSILDDADVCATFFVLGWIAERYPRLVRNIAEQGHEIGSHGYLHQAIYLNDRNHFQNDVVRSKERLEDITGKPVLGYRAPTYSIIPETAWALEILARAGFVYDSSIFPIRHDLYGFPDACRRPFMVRFDGSDIKTQIIRGGTQSGNAEGGSDTLLLTEFPITTLSIGKWNFPVSGGGYFRLLPYVLTYLAVKRLERLKRPFIFYLHPWEISESLPMVAGASLRSRFRTNVNLKRTRGKLIRLLKDFSFMPVREVIRNMGLSFWTSENACKRLAQSPLITERLF